VVSKLIIENIRDLYEVKAVVLTQHFLDKIEIRNIKLADIKVAIMNGEIIEQYPDDYPHPSCLVLGFSDSKPIHIVIGNSGDMLWLITAYIPNIDKWEDDNKTRKVVS